MSASRTEAARRAEAERRAREGRTEAQQAATARLVAARKEQAERQRAAKQAAKELPPMPSDDPDEAPGLRVRDAAYPETPPRPPAPQHVQQDVTQDVAQDVPPPTVQPEKPLQMTNDEPTRHSKSLLSRVLGTGENHGRAAKRR